MQTYIMTIPAEELSKRELLFRLRRRAKRWQFGLELGTHSGYEHYQVRYQCSNGDITLERRIWGDIACELQEAGGWSYYECKDGYFYTSDDDYLGKYRFRGLKELQLAIIKDARGCGERQIMLVIDKMGGIGKTFLGRWGDLNGKGTYIDGSGDIKGINRDIYDISEDRRITRLFIDLTRQTKFTMDLWSGLETIKNGYLKDTRYGYRSKWIAPPEIIVFANHEPSDWGGLSEDRWQRIFINPKINKKKSKLFLEMKTYRSIGSDPIVRNFKS